MSHGTEAGGARAIGVGIADALARRTGVGPELVLACDWCELCAVESSDPSRLCCVFGASTSGASDGGELGIGVRVSIDEPEPEPEPVSSSSRDSGGMVVMMHRGESPCDWSILSLCMSLVISPLGELTTLCCTVSSPVAWNDGMPGRSRRPVTGDVLLTELSDERFRPSCDVLRRGLHPVPMNPFAVPLPLTLPIVLLFPLPLEGYALGLPAQKRRLPDMDSVGVGGSDSKYVELVRSAHWCKLIRGEAAG